MNVYVQTPDELQMEDDDVIDCFLEQGGDIGVFGAHEQREGTALLRSRAHVTASSAQSAKIMSSLGASAASIAPFRFLPDLEIVGEPARAALMAHADAKLDADEMDLMLELTRPELVTLIGAEPVERSRWSGCWSSSAGASTRSSCGACRPTARTK